MFRNNKAFSSFAVADLAKTKDFYGRTLGVKVAETPEGLELHLGGGTTVFVYASNRSTAPQYTVLNFVVDDVEEAVNGLAERGVRMEHYDLPDIKTDERGIFRGQDGPKAIAWFKDPSGHVLSVVQER